MKNTGLEIIIKKWFKSKTGIKLSHDTLIKIVDELIDQQEAKIILKDKLESNKEEQEPERSKEEQETSRTAGEIMFIAEVREDNSDIKIYHVVNSRNKDEAVLKVEKYYEIKAELNGRRYVINIKDYEYIS